MMYDSGAPSPFDQALSKPLLLEEPIRKKWSLFSSSCHDSSSSSSSSTTVSSHDDDQRYHPTTLLQLEYEAPDLEEQGLMMTAALHEETIELDLAILRERHEEIREIHGSMNLVHDIQKDLALIVDSQESYVKHLNAFAIEAYDEAEAGWAHVQAIQKGIRRSSISSPNMLQKTKFPIYGIAASLLLVMGVYRAFMMNASDDAASNTDGGSSSAASKTP